MSFFRKPTKFEWLGVVLLTAVFVWWLMTDCSEVARYWLFAVVALFCVGRMFIKW